MEIKEIIKAPPGLEEINKINGGTSEEEKEETKQEIMPIPKIRKLGAQDESGKTEGTMETNTNLSNLIKDSRSWKPVDVDGTHCSNY